jgi:hypothetical protein
LNSIGKSDGSFQVSANGKQVISFSQMEWVKSASVKFIGIQFETFFGGSDASWATPTQQFTYYKDFKVTILQ